MINQTQLKELLHYNPTTGIFTWIKRPLSSFLSERCGKSWNTKFAGKEAGRIDPSTGYKRIAIHQKAYYCHRLAWVFCFGVTPDQIDHKNHIRVDNRLSNLRNISIQENQKNLSLNAKNKSGITGVIWHKSAGKWMSNINVNGKSIYLGLYDNIFDAACSRKSAEIKHGFYENHGSKTGQTFKTEAEADNAVNQLLSVG